MLFAVLAALSLVSAVTGCLLGGAFLGLSWLWLLPLEFLGTFLGLLLLTFLVVWLSAVVVRTDKPQQKDSAYYRWLIQLLAEAAHTLLGMRVHATGLEKTPKDGRFLLVCNHLHEFDPVVLLHHFRKKQLSFISKRENSSMFVVGKVMHKIQCQLINRENDREALRTIIKCIQILKEDKASVVVFPEGYIHKQRKFQHFRSGVFKIAQKAQVPIVVCTITNTHKVMGNIRRLKHTDIDLHLLTVIQPEEYQGVTTVELGERIHDMMAKDLGPEYALEENT